MEFFGLSNLANRGTGQTAAELIRDYKLTEQAARECPHCGQYTQAYRVFLAFGGPYRCILALRAVGYKPHPVTVYRWDYARDNNGYGGHVPAHAHPYLEKAARLYGADLTGIL